MQVATETRLFLADHDIDVTGVQETKTKNALQYFAKEVKEEMASRAASGSAAADGAAAAGDGSAPEVAADTDGAEAPAEEEAVSADADPD
jgi:hypothetical protein